MLYTAKKGTKNEDAPNYHLTFSKPENIGESLPRREEDVGWFEKEKI